MGCKPNPVGFCPPRCAPEAERKSPNRKCPNGLKRLSDFTPEDVKVISGRTPYSWQSDRYMVSREHRCFIDAGGRKHCKNPCSEYMPKQRAALGHSVVGPLLVSDWKSTRTQICFRSGPILRLHLNASPSATHLTVASRAPQPFPLQPSPLPRETHLRAQNRGLKGHPEAEIWRGARWALP